MLNSISSLGLSYTFTTGCHCPPGTHSLTESLQQKPVITDQKCQTEETSPEKIQTSGAGDKTSKAQQKP